MIFSVYKEEGETPLQCLERFRTQEGIANDVPMTYAGRLDPLAEGALLVLSGDTCKERDQYLGLDKEYEIEILFGFSTDTYDPLGLVQEVRDMNISKEVLGDVFKGVLGTHEQRFPPYSSKTVEGKPLFQHAREKTLDTIEVPKKETTVSDISLQNLRTIANKELLKKIINKIIKVDGDFRQKKIISTWKKTFAKYDVEAEFSEDITNIPENLDQGETWKYRIFPFEKNLHAIISS